MVGRWVGNNMTNFTIRKDEHYCGKKQVGVVRVRVRLRGGGVLGYNFYWSIIQIGIFLMISNNLGAGAYLWNISIRKNISKHFCSGREKIESYLCKNHYHACVQRGSFSLSNGNSMTFWYCPLWSRGRIFNIFYHPRHKNIYGIRYTFWSLSPHQFECIYRWEIISCSFENIWLSRVFTFLW